MNTPPNDLIKAAWSHEYNRKGIPSSFRKDPTQTVVEFISWLQKLGQKMEGLAADIDCGRGRNSFYLASQGFQVKGLELLEENVEMINREAQFNNLPIHAVAQDASMPWPLFPDSLDIAIDVFCYKHIVDKTAQANYRKHLCKALKKSGFYFISLASVDDGFYGPLLETSPRSEEKLIIDPHSQIPSFLYSKEDLIHEFSDLFEAIHIATHSRPSPMYGKEYPRVVLNFVLKKLI